MGKQSHNQDGSATQCASDRRGIYLPLSPESTRCHVYPLSVELRHHEHATRQPHSEYPLTRALLQISRVEGDENTSPDVLSV